MRADLSYRQSFAQPPRVAVLISGSGSNMCALIDAMLDQKFATPAFVISNNADAGGIGLAQKRGVPTAVVDHRLFAPDRVAFEKKLLAALEAAKIDIICLAGFMRILTPYFINHYAGRILNIHPSLLPKYPGLHTHQRAIDAQDNEAGCSVHKVIDALDAGPVLGQAKVPVLKGDTPESLARRVLSKEHILYPETLRRFLAGSCEPFLI